MNVLDENVTRDQADLLHGWGIKFRSISRDFGRQGIQDDNILPFLLGLKKPTLLTRDEDFFDRRLIHARYCLAWFDVDSNQTAFFVRRFLLHPDFRSTAQRLGKIVCVAPRGIEYWSKNTHRLSHARWS